MFLLRYLRWQWRRLRDTVLGHHAATRREIKRMGFLVGPHTLNYSLPTIRHYVYNTSQLVMGDYSSLHETAQVFLGGMHKTKSVTTYPHRINFGLPGAGEDGFPYSKGDTVLGADIWMGVNAVILSGVTVGNGAVIGAGAVISKDVPDYAIVAGNPAQIVRYRHSPEHIEALLEIAWWDWPEDEVKLAAPLLADEDIDAFIAYARERFPDGYPRGGAAWRGDYEVRRTRTT